jgi:predicted peptidase
LNLRPRRLSELYPKILTGLLTAVVIGVLTNVPPCHAGREPQAPLPTIDDEIRIERWQFIGPFSVGPREGIIGTHDDPANLVPDRARYASMLVQGGYVGWKPVKIDSSGWVSVEFEDVLWDTLMDVYGYAGIVNGAYAYSEFRVHKDSRALIVADRLGTFYLNGRPHHGDPYGHGYTRIPVVLKQGLNRVVLKLTGFGDHRFRFAVLPAEAPIITLRDYTVPDIIEGETGAFSAGIPLLNTTGSTIDDAVISIGDGRHVARSTLDVGAVAPRCVKKIPVEIEILSCATEESGSDDEATDESPGDSGGRDLPVPIEINHRNHTYHAYRDTFYLRIRAKGQSFKRTFISSVDSSCQYYAVLPPMDFDPHRRYGLILTLHGANVMAERQVDAYKPKPWAFVVAPTNRRRYGFDWQDWGRLDALEALELARSNPVIDTTRIYLTGHSMGGHGVWHVGLAHPDRFAAMAPGAGWVSFELYIPWFLQKSYIFAEPHHRAARDMCLAEDWPLRFVENARNLPVFILQGGADEQVPPTHARMFARRLDELGYSYRYKEDPGKGHWYSIDSLGVACVDDPDLIGFFTNKVIDEWPRDVVFKTTDVAQSSRAYWVEVVEQKRLYSESLVEAHVRGQDIKISTHNVRQLRLWVSRQLVPAGRARIDLDGTTWSIDFEDSRVATFTERAGAFRMGSSRPSGLAKSARLHGPIKQAYFTPFVLVYGTQGDPAMTDMLLHQARLEAFRWWRRSNGFTEVLPDTEVTTEVIRDYNLILFGGPEANRITRQIDRFLPIRAAKRGLVLAGEHFKGEGLATKFVYPNPLNRSRLVVVHEGVGVKGQDLSTFFSTIYAGAGLPDFLIFDGSVRRKGWGGIIAAGFFDSRWRVDGTLTFPRHQTKQP